MLLWIIVLSVHSIKDSKSVHFLRSSVVIFARPSIKDLCSCSTILFVSELYVNTTMCAILYRLVKFLIHSLFSESSLQINLLKTSCCVIMFSHKNFATAADVVCVKTLISTHSDKSSQTTTMYFWSWQIDILTMFTETFLNRTLV